MMTLRGMVPRNKLLFARNFISVLLVLMLFSCAVVAVYQHQIHRMIVSDIELLNLSALEKNIQTLDAVMLSLRELTYSASAGQEMGAFFDSDPQIDAMQKRFDENLDKVPSGWATTAPQAPMLKTFTPILPVWTSSSAAQNHPAKTCCSTTPGALRPPAATAREISAFSFSAGTTSIPICSR